APRPEPSSPSAAMASSRAAAVLILALLGHAAADEQDADRCGSGSEEACSCLLACPVFGGAGEGDAVPQCHGKSSSELLEIVDDHVRTALQTPGAECDGISCVVECAAKIGCLDEKVQGRCLSIVRDRPTCPVDCGSGLRTLPSVLPMAAAAAALAAAATSY
ncbi:unnamed protein product, partial [Prorocentrum cordatum]